MACFMESVFAVPKSFALKSFLLFFVASLQVRGLMISNSVSLIFSMPSDIMPRASSFTLCTKVILVFVLTISKSSIFLVLPRSIALTKLFSHLYSGFIRFSHRIDPTSNPTSEISSFSPRVYVKNMSRLPIPILKLDLQRNAF